MSSPYNSHDVLLSSYWRPPSWIKTSYHQEKNMVFCHYIYVSIMMVFELVQISYTSHNTSYSTTNILSIITLTHTFFSLLYLYLEHGSIHLINTWNIFSTVWACGKHRINLAILLFWWFWIMCSKNECKCMILKNN